MKIFSNGCSFLGPRPKDGIETYTTKVIADAWQVPLVDSAAGGRGNDRICFTTKLFTHGSLRGWGLQKEAPTRPGTDDQGPWGGVMGGVNPSPAG